MKNFRDGIILGIISIVSSLLFVGIPIGNRLLEIIMLVVFISGLLLIMYYGWIKKDSKKIVYISIAYFILLFILVGFIQSFYQDFSLVAIGFVPGLVISLLGVILSKINKYQYKVKISFILNIIGLILSFISFLFVIVNGGFVIQ